MKNFDIAKISLLTALALIFGYIESLFPLPVSVPGIKLGLSNIVILFALQRIGAKKTFLILTLKVFVSSLLFSGISALIYSLAGGLCAYFAMLAARKCGLSVIGTSAAGAVFHNLGQVAAASAVLGSSAPFYYLSFLLPAGILTGIISGIVCNSVMKSL